MAVREDASLRDLPIVMLSARAGEDAKVEGWAAGADDYLTKPFSARELLARVSANIAMASLRREAAEAVRASEAKAREQAERVQLALDAGAIIGTWVWTVQTNHFVGDERFARSFGLDPARCRAGLTLEDVLPSIHEEDRETVVAEVGEALRRGGPYRCEYRVRQHDGVFRWIEANGRVDHDEDGAPIRFPGVLIDIEHRRAIEAALRELNQQLESRVQLAIEQREHAEEALRQSQKMEAVGQLTGGIAHDFNNLLTGISGNLQLLEARLAQGRLDALPRYIDAAQAATKRAATLTQRLLAFSRRQTLDAKPTNLNRVIIDNGRARTSYDRSEYRGCGGRRGWTLDGSDRSEPVGKRPSQPVHQCSGRNA
jgi:PAS domain S-box-containing protein